ncbi:alpha/beta hydrolase [Gordonia sp. NPDC003585]|uniref:alpha/beta hydrolase n=1 Tax=unclassified Gordonia (in: high G+C Gram-positive bacteria) TaxID=2657482 RepID=UPI00339ECF45
MHRGSHTTTTRIALVAITTVIVALCLGLLAPDRAGSSPSVTTAQSTITATCARQPVTLRAHWYIPARQPTALVWLQHGFSRSARNLDTMARAYAAGGFLVVAPDLDSVNLAGCGVAYNIADNAAFARTIADVFGHASEPDSPLARSLRSAAASRHRDVAMPGPMIFSGHSAGGEFVLMAADALRIADPTAYRRLRGLMLFDPVNSFFGSHFVTAAADLAAARLPIRVIASQPSFSNTFGIGVSILQRTTHQKFLGVRLVTGIHIDVEMESTDLIGVLSGLGAPRPRNGRVIRTLATHWSSDMVSHTVTPAFYPGGSYYRFLLRTNTITTLPVG